MRSVPQIGVDCQEGSREGRELPLSSGVGEGAGGEGITVHSARAKAGTGAG